MTGKVLIQLNDIASQEIERIRQIIHACFEQGIFNVRNGKITLHFDSDGTLQEIEFNVKKWRRNKESLKTVRIYENAKVDVIQ